YTFQSKKPINSPLLIKGKNAMVKGSSTNKLLVWNCTTNTANQALIMGSSDLTPMYVKLKTETPAPVPVPVEHKGIISLLKTGEVFDAKDNKVVYEESPLEGVTFDILAAEDIKAADGTIRLKKGEKADTIITDKDGKAKSCELYLGKYNIVEKETLPGYILLDMPAAVELKYEGQDVALVSAETALHNELKKGSVEIQKTDVSTGEALPETGIEILDQGKKPILQTRTDKEGRAFFDKLPAGNYFFREFDAPKGYQIIEDAFPFEIKENGEIVKCEMTNTKLPVERQPQTSQSPQAPNSPQTGDAHNFWPFVILLLSIAVLVIVVIKKRKRY
ncbi:MAG: SpaA isopeptide-forming pilin-related protein, partial [Clostridia bacterium]|nr:SpaA isopeptide-forming pilin-related protein [Clostridia bacterium]